MRRHHLVPATLDPAPFAEPARTRLAPAPETMHDEVGAELDVMAAALAAGLTAAGGTVRAAEKWEAGG